MKTIFRRIVSIVTITVFCLANIGYMNAAQTTNYNGGELIIKLKTSTNLNSILNKHNVQLAKTVQKLNLHKVKLQTSTKLQDKMNELKSDPLVEYCQYNYQYTASLVPNDTNYSLQWGLPKIKADQAWDISLGNNSITIAVVDSGVDANHPDLSGNLITGYNTIANSINTNDDNGHGTHVAGIAAGITNNSLGISGVAGKSKIMPVKVLAASGSGWTTDIAEGVIWAADHGAKVINMSLGGTSYDQAFQDAVNYAYNKGVLVVAAAGNSNTSAPSYPAAFDHVLAVSATDQNNNRASFSNYGTYVDLAAPGVNIYSSTFDGLYGYKSGTSMACPFVSGAAALVWSQNPSMSPYEVETVLESNAYDIGYLGKDANFGYGLVDLYKSIKAVGSFPLPSSDPSATPSARTSSTPIASATPAPSRIPMGDIDKPSDNETIGGTYTVSGWFLDGSIVSKIEVIVDGNTVGEAVLGDLRTDIGSQYPYYNNNNSGFHYSLDASKLTNGAHTLTIRETSKTGSQMTLPNININVLNKPKTANINYYLSESANVTVAIYDSQNNLVRTLESNVPKPAGWNSSKWDGRDASGRIVPDGIYTYKVTAVDTVGLSTTISGTLIIERLAPSITSVNDSPDPFSPKDGEMNTIEFTLSENASTVIKIFSSNGTLIKTLVDKTLGKGANKVTWDGKNDGGTLVGNGKYTYTIDAKDSFNKSAQQVSGSITIGTTSLVISDNNVNPNPFTPLGSNITTISYTLSGDAKTTVTVFDGSNNVVKVLEYNTDKKLGSNSVSWDGRNASGIMVEDGSYAYQISAVDPTGLEAVPVTGIINVSEAIQNKIISSLGHSPSQFAPDGKKVCTIYLGLVQKADVSINIYDNDSKLVRTLLSLTTKDTGVSSIAWDGKNDSGSLVSDGNYRYIVTAKSLTSGYEEQASGTIIIDSSIPVISDVGVNPDPFAPSVDNNTTISYTLSKDANVTVEIFDATNNPICVLEKDTNKNKGLNSVTWDGKNSSGMTVVDGSYTYKISAVDEAGLTAKPVTGLIHVQGENKPLLSSVNDTPDPFSPNGQNESTITFNLLEDANIVLNVVDSKGNFIKNLITDAVKAGDNKAVWDGKTGAGKVVSNGTYTYTIDAVNMNNDKAQLVSGTITIDTALPVINNTSVNPNPFTPDGTNKTTLSFSLSEKATTAIIIYDKAGSLVKTLESNVQRNSGSNSITWDGRDASGTMSAQGDYTYKITAVDATGTEAKPASGTITILDGQEFLISAVSDTPDPFTPNGKNYSAIGYTVSKDANVTINIYNSKGDLVRTLLKGTVKAGSSIAAWDGKNDAGTLVDNGTFTYKINAADTLGNKAPEMSGTIVVDYTGPVITLIGVSPDPFVTGSSNEATVFYALSENANVSVSILNNSGSVIRVLEPGVEKSAGANTSVWDGKNIKGDFVSTGTYAVKIDAVNAAGLKAKSVTGTIHVVTESVSAAPSPTTNTPIPTNSTPAPGSSTPAPANPSIISAISDTPDPFKPDGTNVNTISFTLSKNAPVTIGIYDMNGKLIKALSNTAMDQGTQTITWDGKNTAGTLVSKGIYIYKIDVTDTATNKITHALGTVTVDYDLPKVIIDSISPIPFESLGDNEVTISYILTKQADTTVEIYDSDNTPVKVLYKDINKLSGINTAGWDGKTASGNLAADGDYTVKITATDFIGQVVTATGTITIKHTIPGIGVVSDSPDPFKPGVEVNTISYIVSKDAKATIKIYDNAHNLVKVLGNADVKAGNNSITWDGKNTAGSFVPEGTYTYTVDAIDSLGFKAIAAIGNITVDLTPPEISYVKVNKTPFTPDGNNTVMIIDQLTEDSDSTIRIFDSSNKLVRTLVSKDSKSEYGLTILYVSSWDGKDSSGLLVSPGTYTFTIDAIDLAGNAAKPATGTIKVEAFDSTAATNSVDFDNDPYAKADFRGDPQTGSNITWNPDYGTEPDSVKEHRTWLNQKGVDITGAPNGFVWSTKAWGTAGQTGVIIGYASPNFMEMDEGLSDNEALTIGFQGNTVDMFEAEITTLPSDEPVIRNNSATVVLKAYDEAGQLVTTKTQTFIGVTTNILTPVSMKIHDNNYRIAKVTLEVTEAPYAGVWIESVNFRKVGSGTTPPPTDNPKISPDQKTIQLTGKWTVTVTEKNADWNQRVHISGSNNDGSYDGTVGNTFVVDGTSSWFLGIDHNSGSSWEASLLKLSAPEVSGSKITYYISSEDNLLNPDDYNDLIVKIEKINDLPITIDKNNVSPNPFAPKPNENSTATISYNLSKDATVTLTIYDSTNSAVKVLEDKVAQKSGLNTVDWDGRNTAGKIVKDGIYTYKITAVDAAGVPAKVVTGTITVDGNAVITSAKDTPDPFSPTGINFSTIKYNLSAEAKITVTIFDNKNNIIKTLINGDIQKASNTVNWDGKDSQGKFVPSGVYTYKIEATGTTKKTNAQVIGTITVSSQNIDIVVPTITAVSDSPDPFGANGTNVSTIKYTLSTDATLTIKVYDSSNNEIKTLVNSAITAGARSITWDGKNDAGTLVSSDGIYTYKIDAVDAKGNKAVQATGTITVDVTPPSIDQYYVEPPIFEPIE